MKRSQAARSLSILLAYAIAFAPATYAADSTTTGSPTPKTQTGGGGNGGKPPILPDILFAGPGGDSNNGKGNGNHGENSNVKTGRFAERWGIDKEGREIYYEGAISSDGKIRVWQHDPQKPRYVRRGIVNPAPGTDGVVQWKSWDSFENLFKERSGFIGINQGNRDGKFGEVYGTDASGREITYEGWRDAFGNLRVRMWTSPSRYMFRRGWVTEVPAAPGAQHSGRYTVKWEKGFFRGGSAGAVESIGANLLDSIQVKSGRTDRSGRAIFETVYFEGRRNAEGLELVFRPDTSTGSMNADIIREGVLTTDNNVIWKTQTRTRVSLINELKNIDLSRSTLTEDQKTKFHENIEKLTQVAKASARAEVLVYRNSNFPAVGSANTPIPSNRALVPIEPSKDLLNKRSGRSENTSPSYEYFKSAEFVAADRPSLMAEKLDWTRAKSEKLGQMLQNWASGRTETVKARAAAKPKTLEDRFGGGKSTVAEFSNGAFTFYAALGIGAIYILMTDYSNNPNAWSGYLSSLQDPVGWAALGGFIVAGAPFYKIMNGPGYQGKVMRQMPLFSAGLLAGSLAATAISKFGRDPDVRKCLGFVAYPLTGKFERDMSACDRAYTHWLTDEEMSNRLAEIGNDFLPTAATILTAGVGYLGALESSQFLISRSGLLNSLRSIPIMKSPRAGALISLGVGVAQVSLFLGAYYIAGTTFNIEKMIKDYQITDFNLNSNMMLLPLWFVPGKQFYVLDKTIELVQQTGPIPAENLRQAETQLYNEWSRVKQNNWKNPNSWKNVCYDAHRKYQKFYNCDAPDALDFEGTLDRYGQFQKLWRTNQLADTFESYKEWMKKVNDYQSQIDSAHTFYKTLVSRVQKGTLNAAELDLSKIGMPSGTSPMWGKDYSGVWKYVDTPKQQDFLLTSMACGPEVEGYGGNDGFWGSTQSLIKNWVTLNYSPASIIKNPNGSEIQFFPPRITNPLSGTKSTICEKAPGLASPLDLLSHVRYSPLDFPAYNEQKNYRGLVDYIRENIRPSVLNGGENNFEAWWSQYVSQETNKIEPMLRAQYKKMLDTTFATALTRHDYASGWCEPSVNRSTGLEKYLRDLSTAPEKCPAEAMHRLAYGVLDSLRDEMRLYLAMLSELYISNATTALGGPIPDGRGGAAYANSLSDYNVAVLSRAKNLLVAFDQMLSELPKSDPSQRNIQEAFQKGDAAGKELAQLILNAPDEPQLAHDNADLEKGTYQRRWALKLLDKSQELFATYKTYYQVLVTFEPGETK